MEKPDPIEMRARIERFIKAPTNPYWENPRKYNRWDQRLIRWIKKVIHVP